MFFFNAMIKNKNDRIKSALGQGREGIYCPVGLQRSLSEKLTLLSCILNPNALCRLPCSYCLSTWHHPSPWSLQWLPHRFAHFALPTIHSLLNRAASVRLLRSKWDDATSLVKTHQATGHHSSIKCHCLSESVCEHILRLDMWHIYLFLLIVFRLMWSTSTH